MKTKIITPIFIALLLTNCGENKQNNQEQVTTKPLALETYSEWQESAKDNGYIYEMNIPNFAKNGDSVKIVITQEDEESNNVYLAVYDADGNYFGFDGDYFDLIPSAMQYTEVAVADWNNDGNKDIRIVHPYMGNGMGASMSKVLYYITRKDGFSQISFDSNAIENGNEVDIDGDGNYEFVVRSLEYESNQDKYYWVDNLYTLTPFGLENSNPKGKYPRVIDVDTKQETDLREDSWTKKVPDGYFQNIRNIEVTHSLPKRKGMPNIAGEPNIGKFLPTKAYVEKVTLYKEPSESSEKLLTIEGTFTTVLRAIKGADGKTWKLCYDARKDLAGWTNSDEIHTDFNDIMHWVAMAEVEYGANAMEAYRLLGNPLGETIRIGYAMAEGMVDKETIQVDFALHYDRIALNYTDDMLVACTVRKEGKGIGNIICGKHTKAAVLKELKEKSLEFYSEEERVFVDGEASGLIITFDRNDVVEIIEVFIAG